MTKDTGQVFEGLKKVLWETFLPYFSFGIPKTLPPLVRALSKLLVKKNGLDGPVTINHINLYRILLALVLGHYILPHSEVNGME